MVGGGGGGGGLVFKRDLLDIGRVVHIHLP